MHRSDRGSGDDGVSETRAYFRRLLGTGGFPHLAAFGTRDIAAPRDPDRTFRVGLDWLLAGATARLAPATEPAAGDGAARGGEA